MTITARERAREERPLNGTGPRVTLDPSTRERRPGPGVRAALAHGRRTYGQDLDNALALSHHPGVFWTWLRFELRNQELDTVLPPPLPELVVFVTAVRIGCSWCVDFGASLWEQEGLDRDVLADAVRWRESDRFDPCARAALGLAEALSGEAAVLVEASGRCLVRRTVLGHGTTSSAPTPQPARS